MYIRGMSKQVFERWKTVAVQREYYFLATEVKQYAEYIS